MIIYPIGQQGEKSSRKQTFPLKEFSDRWSDYPVVSMKYTRPDGEIYPITNFQMVDGDAVWTPSETDMQYEGHGEVQFSFKTSDGNHVGMTKVYGVMVSRSIGQPSSDVPTPKQVVINTMMSILEQAQAVAESIEDISDTAQEAIQAAQDAQEYAESALASKNASATNATNAQTAATNADTYKQNASSSATLAQQAKTDAEAYMQQAKTYSETSTTNANNTLAYKNASAQSAESASSSATLAQQALTALQQGIASGDFKGEKGEKGQKGDPGESAEIATMSQVRGYIYGE